jgi:hypothetical protein
MGKDDILNCKLHANQSMFQVGRMAWAHANGKKYFLLTNKKNRQNIM